MGSGCREKKSRLQLVRQRVRHFALGVVILFAFTLRDRLFPPGDLRFRRESFDEPFLGGGRFLGGGDMRRLTDAADAEISIDELLPGHRVFLNAYFGKNSAIGVKSMVEQLSQIQVALGKDTPVYFNMIGENLTSSIQNLTNSTGVHLMKYYPSAFEEVTLHEVHDYCKIHPNDVVTYLHNKGSFHIGGGNERLRRMGTKAAISDECLSIHDSNSTCSVCGLKFQVHPHSHFPGNMWTAKCSYIRLLTPPLEYESKRRDICRVAVKSYREARRRQSFCPEDVDNMTDSRDLGFGRFALERWIVSHPTFRPCEVFHNVSIRYFQNGWEPWYPELKESRKKTNRMSDIQRQGLHLLMHEFTLLHGIEEPRRGFCRHYFPGRVCPLPLPAFLNASHEYRLRRSLDRSG